MSIEKVRAYLKNMNCPKEVIEFEQSSATVELAAQAAGVIPARITKTLCLMSKEGPIVICVAGDTKIDNRKFKDTFGLKAKRNLRSNRSCCRRCLSLRIARRHKGLCRYLYEAL